MTNNPEEIKIHEPILERIDKRTSSLTMLFGVIVFSFFAGMRIDNGISLLIQAKAQYRWLADFAIGFCFLVVAIRWAVPLLKRAKAYQEDSLVR